MSLAIMINANPEDKMLGIHQLVKLSHINPLNKVTMQVQAIERDGRLDELFVQCLFLFLSLLLLYCCCLFVVPSILNCWWGTIEGS